VTKVIEAIDRLLSGERDEEALREMRRLRETFLSLGEANLAAMTQRDDQGHEGPDGWTRLITSSPS
jgi:hypothetical protein